MNSNLDVIDCALDVDRYLGLCSSKLECKYIFFGLECCILLQELRQPLPASNSSFAHIPAKGMIVSRADLLDINDSTFERVSRQSIIVDDTKKVMFML